MSASPRFRVLRLASMRETPERVEITLETTEGDQVLTFSDPNRERTMALVQSLSRLKGRSRGGRSSRPRTAQSRQKLAKAS